MSNKIKSDKIMSNNIEEIKKVVEEFFEKSCFKTEIESLDLKDGILSVFLKTEEPQILIGENGQTLFAFQHLLNAILKRKVQESFYLDLDINDYKKKKIEYLKFLAKTSADQAVLLKKEKVLFPMTAYERRIIHLELTSRTDVKTESVGEEPERKIVIRPVND